MNYLSNLIGRNSVGPITIPASPQITDVTAIGVFPVATYISVNNRSRIVLKTTFDKTTVTAKARMLFYDLSQNLIGNTDEFQIKNTLESESGRYLGSLFVISNEMGASYVKVRVTTAPTGGNLRMFIAATS